MTKTCRHFRAHKVNPEQVETVVTTQSPQEKVQKFIPHRIVIKAKTKSNLFTLFIICQSKEIKVTKD